MFFPANTNGPKMLLSHLKENDWDSVKALKTSHSKNKHALTESRKLFREVKA
jgi:hypothetical protein